MLRLETRQGYTFSLLLFSIILEVLASKIKQKKEKAHSWNGRNKFPSLTVSIVVYAENAKESTKIYLELITEFNKVRIQSQHMKIYFIFT